MPEEQFVWRKRQGQRQHEESIETSRQELRDIQARRRRQEEIWRQRQMAREESRYQETEEQGLESQFQENIFEYQTLRKKALAKSDDPVLFSALFQLFLHQLGLDKGQRWTFEDACITILGSVAEEEMKSCILTCNQLLENLVILKDLAHFHPSLFKQKDRIHAETFMLKPQSSKQLADEYDFWLNVKTSLLGELWERQDNEGAMTDVSRKELRQLIGQATVNDMWDLGRMISLQLHYACSDDKIDVDFWEAMEKRHPWMVANVWLEQIHKELLADKVRLRQLKPEEINQSALLPVNEMNMESGGMAEDEEDQYGGEAYGRSLLVDGENPNDLFDRLVIREKANEACDSQNSMQGGDYDPWRSESKDVEKKPRYFNRIKLIHEWHKYNQVHYDIDNPPPKSVQGYKFILCYPNATDKPSWKIEEDTSAQNDGSTVLIRFHSKGYKDVGFRIIRREWDLNTKNGYKNFFENGILILSFMFKRNRYRK